MAIAAREFTNGRNALGGAPHRRCIIVRRTAGSFSTFLRFEATRWPMRARRRRTDDERATDDASARRPLYVTAMWKCAAFAMRTMPTLHIRIWRRQRNRRRARSTALTKPAQRT